MSWPTASLRTYLVVSILLGTLPIGVLMFYLYFTEFQAERDRLNETLIHTALVLSQSVERETQSSVDALTILSHEESIQQEDIAHYQRIMSFAPRLRPSWSSVYLLDKSGVVLFDTKKNSARKGNLKPRTSPINPDNRIASTPLSPVVDDPTLLNPVISNLKRDEHTHSYYTTIEVPILINGQIRYRVGARIEVSLWQDMLIKAGAPKGGVTGLFDRDYILIARTVAPEQYVGQRLPSSAAFSMIEKDGGVFKSHLMEGGDAQVGWHRVGNVGWGVGVLMPIAPLEAQHWNTVTTALATALGCLLLGILLALFTARRVVSPLQRLAKKGASKVPSYIPVREISILRNALLTAQDQDELARANLQAQRDLLKTKADEFETLFNSSPIGLIFAQDPECRIITHNAAMNTLFGAYDDSSLGHVRALYLDKTLERADQPLRRAAAHGEAVQGMELEVLIENRAPLYVLVSAVPLLDSQGKPRGAIGAVVDITDRKLAEARISRAEMRLRESQNLVDLAQETGQVGFFHYQFEENELSYTSGHAKLFGIPTMQKPEPLESWIELIDIEDRARIIATLRRMADDHAEKENLEYRIALSNGETRWLSSRLAMTYNALQQPHYLIGITLDVTDQKIIEQERAALSTREKQARFEAEAANRAKDQFLAMLGHELRNPLSAISSAVEVLNRVPGDSDIASNARTIIGRQTGHLAHLMNDLLDMARVISGKVLLTRQHANLALLVSRAVDTLEMMGETQHHQLTVTVEDVGVDADATRIEQIVTNLLTNAIKYTPPESLIEVSVKREGNEAVLIVKDTGGGIPPELLPRIFELFVQGERSLDRRSGGLGIGLTLVRRLTELHGGTVAADSSTAGTTFTIKFPAIELNNNNVEFSRLPESRRRRVVVVEDNPDALTALCSLLEINGHTVSSATDGVSGLDLLLKVRPDIALVDVGLPGLTGLELAKRARAGGYTGRMIAISGYGQQSDIKLAYTSGFDAYLVKPVQSHELNLALAEE